MRRRTKCVWRILAMIPLLGLYNLASCQANFMRDVAGDLDRRADRLDGEDRRGDRIGNTFGNTCSGKTGEYDRLFGRQVGRGPANAELPRLFAVACCERHLACRPSRQEQGKTQHVASVSSK